MSALSRLQWLAFGLGLIGVFIASVIAGGVLSRQLRTSAGESPIAAASPSPAATVSAAPLASATPAVSARPVATASPSPISSPLPTDSPVPAPSLDPATAEQFAADLVAAIREGDVGYLRARLHPAVAERYSERMCRRYIRDTFTGGVAVEWQVLAASGPADWSWITDEIETVMPGTWTVSISQPGADPPRRDAHFTPFEGTWRWFTDCGTPT